MGFPDWDHRLAKNLSSASTRQAKRAKQDPRVLKEMFKECWSVSDTPAAFRNALEERGFYLAKGDRRGHVAVDWHGEVFAISKWVGVKAKDVCARLGDANDLSSVDAVKEQIAERFSEKLKTFCAETEAKHEKKLSAWKQKRADLVATQRQARTTLRQSQKSRHVVETKSRASRLPKGIKAIWFRITGKYQKIRKQNEAETQAAEQRDRRERQKLIVQQLAERCSLQHDIRQLRYHHEITIQRLWQDVATYLSFEKCERKTGIENLKHRMTIRRQRKKREP